ncbi:MAG: zinc ABC transporter substrate-binding protein [Chthonomonadales bacterium]|nr:zinc ABC transporter substrate-binding protein [Chthonomonadales bacterium]
MRTIKIVLIGSFIVAGLAGCRQSVPKPTERRIVCSTFPVWLLTRNVAQGRTGIRVELLLPAGLGCPHDYVVTPQDARKIEEADVLVVNGLGLDDFAAERFRKAKPEATVIVATDGVADDLDHHRHGSDGAGPHTADDDGATARHEHEHDGETAEAHSTNAHLFSSPRLAGRMARVIATGLASVDPEGAALYRDNAAGLARRLDALAEDIRAAVAALPNKRIVAQHDILDAFAADAGLEIVGYIHVHAGHEPSAQEIIALVRTARQRKAAAVMIEPQYSARIGQTIAREAGIPIGMLDPVASGPDDAPLDYYETVMRRNIEALRKALAPPSARH